ncbi:hypothetical protein, partial [Thermoflexus hugenholtzii]
MGMRASAKMLVMMMTMGVVLVGVLGFLIWAYPRVVRRRPAGLEGSGHPMDSHSHKPGSG